MTTTTSVHLHAYRHRLKNGTLHLRARQVGVFDADLKEHLHRVGTPARWVAEEMAWDWPFTQAAVRALLEKAAEAGVRITWEDGLADLAAAHHAQSEVEKQTRIAVERVIRDAAIPLDPYTTRVLKPNGEPCPPLRHQQIAFHWAQRVRGLALWWDPGTGKTRAGCDAAGGWFRHGVIRPMTVKPAAAPDEDHGVRGGVLVVCPKSMMLTWQREAQFWQGMQALVIAGTARYKKSAAAQPAHLHIVNYEGLKYVLHSEYDAVIFDEIHWLANATDRTEFSQNIVLSARRILGLSGTPISKEIESIFFPALIIDGGRALGPSQTAFREKYFKQEIHFNGGGKGKDKDKKGRPRVEYAALDDSAERIAAAIADFSYYVRKSDAGINLPEKTFRPVYLPMSEDQRAYYEQLRRDFVLYIDNAEVTAEQAAKRLMKLWQLCQGFVLTDVPEDDPSGGSIEKFFSHAKEEALVEALRGEFKHRKVVVWAYFKAEIRRLCEILEKHRIPYVRADGDVPQKARDQAVDAWNSDPNLRVFIRQYSMSEGVTLHAKDCATPCADSIYLGWSWRLVDWLQSQDRIHRIGQKYPCSYTVFMTDSGIDRQMYERVLQRAQVGDAFVNYSKDFYRSLLDAPAPVGG